MTGPPGIEVSIVVPVFNDEARLGTCLAALDAQTADVPFEVLVVDNGSRTPPAHVVDRHPRARLLHESERGSYAARNRGVSEARGRVLAFTDSDCTPAEDWVERALAAVDAQAGPAFVAGRVEVVPQSASPTWIEEWDLVHAFPQQRYVERLSFGVTANLIVSRADFDSAGPFDAHLQSSGDREWGQRAASRGLQPVYAEDVVVAHPARRSLGEARAKIRRVSTGAVRLADEQGRFPLGEDFRALVLRPPLRTILRTAVALKGRRGAKYAAAALTVHAMHVSERIAAYRATRSP